MATVLYYLLWRYVKSIVYSDQTEMIDFLENNIWRVIVATSDRKLSSLAKIYSFKPE